MSIIGSIIKALYSDNLAPGSLPDNPDDTQMSDYASNVDMESSTYMSFENDEIETGLDVMSSLESSLTIDECMNTACVTHDQSLNTKSQSTHTSNDAGDNMCDLDNKHDAASSFSQAECSALSDVDDQHGFSAESETRFSEPQFKYERLTLQWMSSDLALSSDFIVRACVHTKWILLGTRGGSLLLLDYLGNCLHRLELCQSPVTGICVDSVNGEAVACGFQNGSLFVCDIFSSTCPAKPLLQQRQVQLDGPVLCVALDPHFARTSRLVAAAGSRILLFQRSLLVRRERVILLHDCGACVLHLVWNTHAHSAATQPARHVYPDEPELLAWACSSGQVRVYHVLLQRVISVIRVPCDNKRVHGAHTDTCHLCWHTAPVTSSSTFPSTGAAVCVRLMVAWKQMIQICVLRHNSTKSCARRREDVCSDYYMEITHIVPLSTAQLLGITADQGGEDRVISLTMERSTLCVSVHQLSAREAQLLGCDQLSVHSTLESVSRLDLHYRLCGADTSVVLTGPTDVIVVTRRDTDDRVDWLLETGRCEQAYAMVRGSGGGGGGSAWSRHTPQRHSVRSVGVRCIEQLMRDMHYERASQLAREVCGRDLALWEDQVHAFACAGQLHSICEHVPCAASSHHLRPGTHTDILLALMRSHPDVCARLLATWPSSIYSSQRVIHEALTLLLHDAQNTKLLRVLALLYQHHAQRQERLKAVQLLLKLCDPDVFRLIVADRLYTEAVRHVHALVAIDREQSLRLLAQHACMHVHTVVSSLQGSNQLIFTYLRHLKTQHPEIVEYDNIFVELYAHFVSQPGDGDSGGGGTHTDVRETDLLLFLRTTDTYSLSHALAVCQRCALHTCTVYLLRRSGDTLGALRLVIECLDDLDQAIDLCANDRELWDALVTCCVQQPDHVQRSQQLHSLVLRLGVHVAPLLTLLTQFPRGVHVPGLHAALVNALGDCCERVQLARDCRDVTAVDCAQALGLLSRCRGAGVSLRLHSASLTRSKVCVYRTCRHNIATVEHVKPCYISLPARFSANSPT